MKTYNEFLVVLAVMTLAALAYATAIRAAEPHVEVRERVKPTDHADTVLVLVHWYESEEALSERFAEDLDGLSDYYIDDDIGVCDIHAVAPEFVYNDPRMDTLGHELLHCLKGDYHEE